MNFPASVAEAILSTKSDAIIAADKEGSIFFWNPGANRIFGYESADAVGRSLDIIIPERLQKRHWAGYRRVILTGQSNYGDGDILAVPAVRKDGSEVSLEFTIIALRGATGKIAGLVAIIRDVTKRFEEVSALKRKLAEVSKASQ